MTSIINIHDRKTRKAKEKNLVEILERETLVSSSVGYPRFAHRQGVPATTSSHTPHTGQEKTAPSGLGPAPPVPSAGIPVTKYNFHGCAPWPLCHKPEDSVCASTIPRRICGSGSPISWSCSVHVGLHFPPGRARFAAHILKLERFPLGPRFQRIHGAWALCQRTTQMRPGTLLTKPNQNVPLAEGRVSAGTQELGRGPTARGAAAGTPGRGAVPVPARERPGNASSELREHGRHLKQVSVQVHRISRPFSAPPRASWPLCSQALRGGLVGPLFLLSVLGVLANRLGPTDATLE